MVLWFYGSMVTCFGLRVMRVEISQGLLYPSLRTLVKQSAPSCEGLLRRSSLRLRSGHRLVMTALCLHVILRQAQHKLQSKTTRNTQHDTRNLLVTERSRSATRNTQPVTTIQTFLTIFRSITSPQTYCNRKFNTNIHNTI